VVPHERSRTSWPATTSSPGTGQPGTRTRNRSSGPRPPTRSSNPSATIATHQRRRTL